MAFLKGINWSVFAITLVLAVMIARGPVRGQEKPAVTTKDLKDIVSLLEDPKKREDFTKDLDKLIQAREALERESTGERRLTKIKRRVLYVEKLFLEFDNLSKKIAGAAVSTVHLLRELPEATKETFSFLASAQNQARLLKLVLSAAAALFLALVLRGFLKKYQSKEIRKRGGVLFRIGRGAGRVVLSIAPHGTLLVLLFLFFHILPSFRRGQSLTLLFFLVLFFYGLAIAVFRALLDPEHEKRRILPLTDENANYLWVWLLRFANYTAFFVWVTKTLWIIGIDKDPYAFIRGFLLLVFPCMISLFILQVGREFRTRYSARLSPSAASDEAGVKGIFTLLRYIHLLVLAYIWAVFLFLMIEYQDGFHYLFMATLGTAITVLGILLALRLQTWIFHRFFALSDRVKRMFPGLEEKTNRYILILSKAVRAVLIIVGLGIIAQQWGIPVSKLVASKAGTLIILRIIAIALTISIVVAIIESCRYISDALLKEKKNRKVTQKRKTLIPMVRTSINIGAGFIGGVIVLDQIGVNITPILAGAGIIGLAVGFGSQTLVKDLINGLFILFEESIRVGDYAVLGSKEGMVEAVGLRTVKLRDVAGNVHVIPNSAIETLTNMSKEFSRTVLDIGVAYREDVDEVMEVLRTVGEEMRNDPEYGKNILEPIEIFGLQKFDDSALVIRARLTTKPLKQWGLKREFNRRIKRAFDAKGIEIPFPHRTIYMGVPKEGQAPPMHVQMGDRDGEKEP